MSVAYIDVGGITETCKAFRDDIKKFDQCVTDMDRATKEALSDWVGEGRNQFETQMRLMESQLSDISDVLYEIYEALSDAEAGYIDEDETVAKQFSMQQETAGGR